MNNKWPYSALLSIVRKQTGAHALIDYTPDYIQSLPEKDAKWLLEALNKMYFANPDKPSDLIQRRTSEQLKADYRQAYMARNDVMNRRFFVELEK